MPPVTLRARFNPDEIARAQSTLRELGQRARNVAGGLKIVGEALLKNQLNRFRDEADPDGRPWAKLRPLTVMIRGGATGPILRRSGQLMRSSNYRVSGSTLRIGISGIQAAAQQFGATIVPKKGTRLAIPIPAARGGRNIAGVTFAKKVTIPARRMVGFGQKDEAATRRAVSQWLRVEAK